MGEQLQTSQEEWKLAKQGLQTWDQKMEAYRTKQQQATNALAMQVKGLHVQVEQAKKQTLENQLCIATEEKKKFRPWRPIIKNLSRNKLADTILVATSTSRDVQSKVEGVKVEWDGVSRSSSPALEEMEVAVATK